MSAAVHAVGHLARRGAEHFSQMHGEDYLDQLRKEAFNKHGLTPYQMIAIAATGLLTLLIMSSIEYTLSGVMATLAMIESPSSTTIIEPRAEPKDDEAPPAYTDEADAPLEKEALLVEADAEVTVINHKPITSKVTSTIGHLRRVGGFFARWRGLRLAMLYNFAHGFAANGLANLIGFGMVGHVFAYTSVTFALIRVHMAWTHSVIAHPTSKSSWKRITAVPREQLRHLLMPTFHYALAQQAVVLLPLGVAVAFGQHGLADETTDRCKQMMRLIPTIIAVIVTFFVVAIGLVFPATVTLTRIEALLLPEDEETIVPFDKEALTNDGEIDLTVRGSSARLFVQAWRSFDRPARFRLLKVYAKSVLAQLTVGFIGLHLMLAELYVFGGEHMGKLIKSAIAQGKLMAIEAHKQH